MNDILSTGVYTIHTMHSHGFKNGINPLLPDHNKVTFVGIFKTSCITVFHPLISMSCIYTGLKPLLHSISCGIWVSETWKIYN